MIVYCTIPKDMFRKHPITILLATYAPALEGVIFAYTMYDGNSLFNTITLVGLLILFIALALASILKRLFRRERPPTRNEYFRPFGHYAFPSGHATGMVALATYILLVNPLPGVLAYVCACIVMIARVHAHVHDALDMAGGTLLGILVACAVYSTVAEVSMLHFF